MILFSLALVALFFGQCWFARFCDLAAAVSAWIQAISPHETELKISCLYFPTAFVIPIGASAGFLFSKFLTGKFLCNLLAEQIHLFCYVLYYLPASIVRALAEASLFTPPSGFCAYSPRLSPQVKVVCRFRPPNERELSENVEAKAGGTSIEFLDDLSLQVNSPGNPPQVRDLSSVVSVPHLVAAAFLFRQSIS